VHAFAPNYRASNAFSAQKPDRFLLIPAQWVHFRVKTGFFARHFVIVSCVFIHIAGSTFIFNISKYPRPVPDADVAPTFRACPEHGEWVGKP
jgi:hypothetical protein